MKNYNLTFLPLFEEDLNQIVDYISLQLQNPMVALQLVDQVYTSIQERLPFAESFEEVTKKEREATYYRIYVNNFMAFYVVQGTNMEVRRILYGRQDWKKHLQINRQ